MYSIGSPSDISHIFIFKELIGVYILYNEIECRYVGESTNVIKRVISHYGLSNGSHLSGGLSGGGYRKSAALSQDQVKIVKFIEVRNNLLRMVTEAFWIWKLNPTLAARPSPYPSFIGWDDKEVFEFIKKDFKTRGTWKYHHERRI